jgi:hypothetical protein
MEELSNNASDEADYDGPNDAHVCAPACSRPNDSTPVSDVRARG